MSVLHSAVVTIQTRKYMYSIEILLCCIYRYSQHNTGISAQYRTYSVCSTEYCSTVPRGQRDLKNSGLILPSHEVPCVTNSLQCILPSRPLNFLISITVYIYSICIYIQYINYIYSLHTCTKEEMTMVQDIYVN